MLADRDSDVPVMVDFDLSGIRGSPLPAKPGELREGACTAEFENDDYVLEILQGRIQKA